MTVNRHEAKTHFSKLVESAINGKEVIIAKAEKLAVQLAPARTQERRIFGVLKGKVKMEKGFDAPLSDELLDDFEGQ